MLKIGTFSKLSRLSIRMLRRYDELGLLQPVHTDPFTGYRYYREEQLTTAGRITALRDMGFGLSAIGALLARKYIYFVPFGQDDPLHKPTSLVADFTLVPAAAQAALEGYQLQPLLTTP